MLAAVTLLSASVIILLVQVERLAGRVRQLEDPEFRDEAAERAGARRWLRPR